MFPDLRPLRQWIAVVTYIDIHRSGMILLVALITSGANFAHAQINWQTNLKAAHAQAQAEGKLLLMHFYDDNCVWCDRLEKGAFATPEVAAAISKDFIGVKVHAGKSPAIASTFKVTRFPTDVIVTTQGQALSHTVSPQDPARYIAMLTQHVPSTPQADSMLANSGPAAAPPTPQITTSNSLPAMSAVYSMPQSSPGTAATPVSSRPISNSPAVADKSLELAMDGYCAVTVIEQDRWIEGKSEFGVVHLGQLYLFSSKVEMDKFLANPEPYTPMLNGIDVVRFFEERKVVQGNREWGLKDPDHNRMFFFADEEALNHFFNQHTRYTDAAMAVMAKAVSDANPKR